MSIVIGWWPGVKTPRGRGRPRLLSCCSITRKARLLIPSTTPLTRCALTRSPKAIQQQSALPNGISRDYAGDMPVYVTLPIVTASAGLLAGAGAPAFAAAALSAAAAAWFTRLGHSDGFYLHVTLDPDAPDNGMLAGAIREALSRLRLTQRPVTLRIAAFRASPHPRISLSLARNGDLEILCDRKRPCALGHPGLWIADHPLSLHLSHTRGLTLRFMPSGQERVRVACQTAAPVTHNGWIALFSVAVAACAFDSPCLLAAALGFAGQAYLLEHHPDCPRDHDEIKPR